MTGPITLEEVARAAGVSRSTASRVINGDVASPQSVKAVNRAVKRLGYVPNRAARTLASQHTDQVAIITPESPTLIFLDPFVAVVSATTAHSLWQAGLVPLLALMDPADPVATTKQFLHRGNVDGIIVTHLRQNDELRKLLTEADLPIVFIGRPPDGIEAPYVDADNVHSGYIATEYLLKQGRRRIACVGGPLTMPSAVDRRTGFLQAHHAVGVEPGPYVELDFHSASAAAATVQLLEQRPETDAVFAETDFLAAGVLQGVAMTGRSVPGDVAVVGHDDSATATQVVPQLTTVAQPVEQLGPAAAGLMVQRLRTGQWGEWPQLFPTELVIRDSA
ncbi:MAG: LacI family transcriptional regulator [Bifidobacteriaceae bacterium]|jgi:DNA-binding LacI/PurR family transcriptional regulator|nr:LacI family transcriptional regulator [Bifidobacteriaceae bacterium]